MENNKKGMLIVFSGPAGAGKSTVLKGYMAEHKNCIFSVSATTRKPRPGEQDGVNYYFVSREQFEQMLANGEMLEHTYYCGNYYGTPLKPVLEALDNGLDVVFDIEVEGAFNVKAKYPEALLIFMHPATMAELRSRLEGRGTESPEVIEKRLARAEQEIALSEKYDCVVISDTVEQSIADFTAAVEKARAERKL